MTAGRSINGFDCRKRRAINLVQLCYAKLSIKLERNTNCEQLKFCASLKDIGKIQGIQTLSISVKLEHKSMFNIDTKF